MDIKSDKTFEEIVERLVALFAPQPQNADTVPPSRSSSSDVAEHTPSASTRLPRPKTTRTVKN